MPHARTVSVLFTDVVASTELLATLGDMAADEVRRDHQAAITDVVNRHRGQVVKTLGDGVMAVFDGAADAVDAAVGIQDVTAQVGRRRSVGLRVRVGMSSGDASSEDGDWHGTPVVEAARLCDAARGGQILVGDLTRRLAGSRTDVAFASLGPLALKGLPEPMPVHEVLTAPHAGSGRTNDTAATQGPVSLSRIYIVGAFNIQGSQGMLSDGSLGSRKARTLLKLLVVRRGHFVQIDTIVDALWGDEAPPKAVENIATLVSRLRGRLGAEVIEGGRAGYRFIVPADCDVDLDEAERMVIEADSRLTAEQPALAANATARALELLGFGRLLEDETRAPWIDEAERDVHRLLRRARATAWRSRFALDDNRAALAAAQQAVEADGLDEEAHRAVMLAYHRLGESGEALSAYQRLRDVLVEELGAAPGTETEDLYVAILRGETVADATSGTTRPHESESLAGRAEEIAQLVDAWAIAASGTASCVLITGEAGIGKTRLSSELANQARSGGALVVETRCYEAERSLFLQPIVEALRSITGSVAPDAVRDAAGDWAGPLGALVPDLARITRATQYEPAGGEVERRRIFEAVASFLAALARRRPVLLVLDDLQNAGASTVELCHFVLRWEPAARVMIVATLRADEGADAVTQLQPLATRLEVGPLPEEAVHALAREAGVGDLGPTLLKTTRGHTLFVLEALRAVAEGTASAEEVPVPASLRSAVLARTERCGNEIEEFLRGAVVVGSAFQLDTVVALLDMRLDDAARRAEVALRAHLLVEAGNGYQFANDLIRDVLYESVPAPTRVVRHRRMAELLSDQPEAAAGHSAAAGDWANAFERWLEAASTAMAAFANAEAELLLTDAINAASHLDDPGAAARAFFLRGRARQVRPNYRGSAADLAEAQTRAAAAGDIALEGAAIEQQGFTAYYMRDMPRARDFAARARAHPAAGPGGALLSGRVHNADGDLAGAQADLEPLTHADVDPAVRAAALSFLGTVLTQRGQFNEALRTVDAAVALCRQTGALRPLLQALMFGAIARADLGDFSAALTWAEQLRSSAERYDAPPYVPRALNILASIWRELGQPERSHDLAEEALARSTMPDGAVEGEPAAHALVGLAEAALTQGDDAAVVEWLGQIKPMAAGIAFGWRVEMLGTEVMSRLEPGHSDALLDAARRHESAKYEALALAALGRVDEALVIARATGSDPLLARVAPEALAISTLDGLAAKLPDDLREGFQRRVSVLLASRPKA